MQDYIFPASAFGMAIETTVQEEEYDYIEDINHNRTVLSKRGFSARFEGEEDLHQRQSTSPQKRVRRQEQLTEVGDLDWLLREAELIKEDESSSTRQDEVSDTSSARSEQGRGGEGGGREEAGAFDEEIWKQFELEEHMDAEGEGTGLLAGLDVYPSPFSFLDLMQDRSQSSEEDDAFRWPPPGGGGGRGGLLGDESDDGGDGYSDRCKETGHCKGKEKDNSVDVFLAFASGEDAADATILPYSSGGTDNVGGLDLLEMLA